MRTPLVSTCCLLLSLVAASCSRPAATDRTYSLQGQILSIDAQREQATIKHGDIKGFMSAMTMPYRVKETALLDGLAPGDLIDATLTVTASDAFLSEVKKTGSAPLEQAAEAPAGATPAVAAIEPGGQVPNARFLDQDGKARDFASFKGSTLVITFIYTTCPLPDFCPLMDRNFRTIQTSIKADPSLKKVRLVSISIDPDTDTPPVLKAHAKELDADPKYWTLLTGTRDDIDHFGSSFGLSVKRPENDLITHTLRTAIIDGSGKLVKTYIGNKWTPADVVADLKGLP